MKNAAILRMTAAIGLALAATGAQAQTEIQLWHSMTGTRSGGNFEHIFSLERVLVSRAKKLLASLGAGDVKLPPLRIHRAQLGRGYGVATRESLRDPTAAPPARSAPAPMRASCHRGQVESSDRRGSVACRGQRGTSRRSPVPPNR